MTSAVLTLLEPTLVLKDEFLGMAAEFQAEGVTYSHHERARNDFGAFLDEMRAYAQGIGLPAGHVPMTTFWLVREDEHGKTVLGEGRLRHCLNSALEVEGGHIGYAIRPSARRQGYGTRILALTLEKARRMGLQRVLVTCDRENIASARVIEKNGGLLSGKAVSPRTGKAISQYWIELPPLDNPPALGHN
jgi:predicted acetyltransferase